MRFWIRWKLAKLINWCFKTKVKDDSQKLLDTLIYNMTLFKKFHTFIFRILQYKASRGCVTKVQKDAMEKLIKMKGALRG